MNGRPRDPRASMPLYRRDRVPHRHIAAPRQKAPDRDVLVQIFPGQALPGGANPKPLALCRCRVKQTRKPRQRNPDRAAIVQRDPQGRVVEPGGMSRNVRAMPPRFLRAAKKEKRVPSWRKTTGTASYSAASFSASAEAFNEAALASTNSTI
jgi:hypothetical protein